ncbi:hypothetical protein [Thiolapillus sp.]|uniref:hypothetical protein n=1 Tax=Thiolapillus sp. TaxID=2017437 RepID=UPI003AF8C89D
MKVSASFETTMSGNEFNSFVLKKTLSKDVLNADGFSLYCTREAGLKPASAEILP